MSKCSCGNLAGQKCKESKCKLCCIDELCLRSNHKKKRTGKKYFPDFLYAKPDDLEDYISRRKHMNNCYSCKYFWNDIYNCRWCGKMFCKNCIDSVNMPTRLYEVYYYYLEPFESSIIGFWYCKSCYEKTGFRCASCEFKKSDGWIYECWYCKKYYCGNCTVTERFSQDRLCNNCYYDYDKDTYYM